MSPLILKISIFISCALAVIFPIIFFPTYIRDTNNYNTITYSKKEYNSNCNQISNNLISPSPNFTNVQLCNNTFENCVSYNSTDNDYNYYDNNGTHNEIDTCDELVYDNTILLDNNQCIYINYTNDYYVKICSQNGTNNTYVNSTSLSNTKCFKIVKNNILYYVIYNIVYPIAPQENNFGYKCLINVTKDYQIFETYKYLPFSNKITHTIDYDKIDFCCCNSKCPQYFTDLNQSCIFGNCSLNGLFNEQLYSGTGIGLAIFGEIIIVCIIVGFLYAYKKAMAQHF
jgi:hypothetical protein